MSGNSQPGWHHRRQALILLIGATLAPGCVNTSGGPEVVVYTSLDREFSEPILKQFQRETGIRVRAKYDTESTKTVGLATEIIAESRQRTRCDLWWNNEILWTLKFDQMNLLETYQPRNMTSYPPYSRSSQHRWFGFAARARVLVVNTEIVSADAMPDSIYDLLDARWKGQIGIAKPLFGSTATHAACLWQVLGDAKAKEFFSDLLNNEVQILSGNKQVAEDVAAGKLAIGLTDTDDAIIEIEDGQPVKIIYPDSMDGQLGTLFIPNTLALLKGAPRTANAKKLMDYLLTAEVEKRLSAGKSAQIPLHRDVQIDLRVETPNTIQPMEVNFERAAMHWDDVADYLKREFAIVK